MLASSGGLVAAGRTWATGTIAGVPPLPARELAVTGAEAGTPVRGLAVVGLAGAVAVIAARGWLRPLVGLLLVLAGVGMVAAGLGFDPERSLAGGSGSGATTIVVGAGSTAWPVLAAACGAGLATAGALVALRGRRWGGMSQKYDSPAPAPAPEQQDQPDRAAGERQLWEALDRGEDPTRKTPTDEDPTDEDPTGRDATGADPTPRGPGSADRPPTGGADLPSR